MRENTFGTIPANIQKTISMHGWVYCSNKRVKGYSFTIRSNNSYYCEMVKKPPDLSDEIVVVKMKSQREDCLPQTLRVAVMNGKIHMNVKNTGQGDLHLLRGQNIGIVDLRSAGYYHITRDGIQKCLHERFIFLNEEDFQDYLSLSHTLLVKNHKRIQDLM